MRRRTALVALTAVLVAGVVAWRLVSVHNARPQLAVVSAPSALLGTWTAEDGGPGRIELAAHGRFSAVGLWIETDEQFTGTGRWSLSEHGGSVQLVPDGRSADTGDQPSLGVVRADGRTKLCIRSGSPGVLCDILLGRP
ncbi:hypothetical protein AB0I00_25825 [Streptomyces sp. NPDC050803]|uniref:hypothetical protein n=1 Tax=unclassified Streptomyces TaxID=2593676 RepID=UPI0034244A1A